MKSTIVLLAVSSVYLGYLIGNPQARVRTSAAINRGVKSVTDLAMDGINKQGDNDVQEPEETTEQPAD